ncbi:MAG TPA: response regulator [Planctomycetaceae bacterium]
MAVNIAQPQQARSPSVSTIDSSASRQGAQPRETPSDETRQGRRVLVVDDNKDAALCLSLMLRQLGHEARTAHDGVEALALAAEFCPDLVLLDIGMPNVNGYETCRRIRAESWGRTMTLVALTGWGQDDDRRRSQEAGFDEHLLKPVELAVLKRVLDTPRATSAT